MAETILDLQNQITKLETELIEMHKEDKRLCKIIGETKIQKAILEQTIQKQNEVINLLTQIIELSVTDPDGFERAKIIPKENLSSIEIIYQQDLEPPTEETTTNEVMYQ